jgi:hypothetical protein
MMAIYKGILFNRIINNAKYNFRMGGFMEYRLFICILALLMILFTSDHQNLPKYRSINKETRFDDSLVGTKPKLMSSGAGLFDKRIKSILAKTDRSDFEYIPKKKGHYTAEQWHDIIDSTWGEGLPTGEKLDLFDQFWNTIDREYPSFHHINVDWDSLRDLYRPEVEAGVSRGRFNAILSKMAESLWDVHTGIRDVAVAFDTLKPGVPIFVASGLHSTLNIIYGGEEFCHFGASLSPMPDSSLFVYNVVEDHPLGLETGDIVVGYDNIPWKQLYKELLEAELPFWGYGMYGSSKQSIEYSLLTSAGENWHLFDVIDVIKYGSSDTLHLSTALLQDQQMQLINTDQLPVPGVPFPDINNEPYVSSGIVDGINIGYIYSWDWGPGTGGKLYDAVKTFVDEFNITGLIIDSRYNFGGYAAEVSKALSIFFNEDQDIIHNFVRSDPNDHLALERDFSVDHYFHIDADNYLFDKPIALLTGPTSISGGDVAPFELRYHPMVRTFGRATNGAFGSIDLVSYELPADWTSIITLTNEAAYDHPDDYLTHRSIEPDEHVWLEPDDVVKGEDTVVKRAIEWIQNLAYAHDVMVDKTYAVPETEHVVISTTVENPNEHEISVEAVIRNVDSTITDNLTLYDDGVHGDGESEDKLWGNFYPPTGEHFFKVSVTTNDHTEGTQRSLPNVAWFTTEGPVIWKDYSIEQYNDSLFALKATLENISSVSTIPNVSARLSSNDDNVTRILRNPQTYPDIEPGQSVESNDIYGFALYAKNNPQSIQLILEIISGGYHFWTDSLEIVTSIQIGEGIVPVRFAMEQNYPNPFNPSTTIEFALPKSEFVELKVYNILGKEVATLVSMKLNQGNYTYTFDGKNLASGIYYYQLVAGEYNEVRKMILLR